ncbi:MAG: hypothetical protein BHW64_01100 [Candidatus Melainabacteria bacterium LEY3_CP_29_8]|nr:MAG: hypothetical protein BHW64_01100 [Candidatus Melainabacteria bacterium LEY3_CP_29_8]
MYNINMIFKYKVIVKLRDGVKDAKGEAVSNVLKQIDSYSYSPAVYVGKYFEFNVEANNENIAGSKAINIIEDVFINPILETYNIVGVEKL